MNFSTKVPLNKCNNPIDYDSKIISLGSCFAENMAEKFHYFKFQNWINPFGIIFNPVSIEKVTNRIVNKIEFTEQDIFFHNDLWHCFEVHSELSNPNKMDFLINLNQILLYFNNQITQSTHIIITYGTSWVYRNIDLNQIVANCHKVPQNQFDKEILSVEVIEESIKNTVDLIQKVNPKCTFIFTISPVRHIKDGFVENQRSKAHLIAALHSSIFHFPSSLYFPSYEIMMDELRDYRFYADDMLHPSHTAINYIWENFCDSAVSHKCLPVMKEVASIQKAILHKPFHPNSQKHQKFLDNIQQKINTLASEFPNIQF